MVDNIYPNLKQFFSGYFFPDWKKTHDWQGQEPNFEAVVRLYAEKNPQEMVSQTLRELTSLIKQNYGEEELRYVVNRQLGSAIYVPGLQLTYHQWLLRVQEILIEEMMTP